MAFIFGLSCGVVLGFITAGLCAIAAQRPPEDSRDVRQGGGF